MRDDDDFIGRLEDYLESVDGATPLPDRVRDAVRAELPTARQARPRPGVLRFLTMFSNASAGVRVGIAAAVIVVAVGLGTTFVINQPFVGGGPTAAPTPTFAGTVPPSPSPSSAASSTAEPATLGQAPAVACDATDTGKDCGAPGTYQLNKWAGPRTWPAMVTVDEPAGWFNWDPGPGWDALLVADAGGTGSGWGVMFYSVGDVAHDPCDLTKGWIPGAQVDTPQKLAEIMAAWPKFTATTPEPITIDGHDGSKFKLTAAAERSCGDAALAGHSTSGTQIDLYPMTSTGAPRAQYQATVEIVDTGNGLLVIRATDFPETTPAELGAGLPDDPTRHATDQAALHEILDSIKITPWPASS
jgi:hypothetical protein